MVGETNRFLEILSSWINSSKVKTILSALKFNVESAGTTDTNTGGSVSRGPPVGGILFAHPAPVPASHPIPKTIPIIQKKYFILLTLGKTTPLRLNNFLILLLRVKERAAL